MNQQAVRRQSKRKLVGHVGELTHGTSKKFVLQCAGHPVEGLLINYRGDLFAYVNRCRHIGISLDWLENQFFTEDLRYLICANHGAIYEPKTGECIWGPCVGDLLQIVPLQIEGDKIFARCPESEADVIR